MSNTYTNTVSTNTVDFLNYSEAKMLVSISTMNKVYGQGFLTGFSSKLISLEVYTMADREVLDAINGIGTRLDAINTRIDDRFDKLAAKIDDRHDKLDKKIDDLRKETKDDFKDLSSKKFTLIITVLSIFAAGLVVFLIDKFW